MLFRKANWWYQWPHTVQGWNNNRFPVEGHLINIDPAPGKTWHFYVVFTAAGRSRQLDSVYFGRGDGLRA